MRIFFLNCGFLFGIWRYFASLISKLLCFIKKRKNSLTTPDVVPLSIKVQGGNVSLNFFLFSQYINVKGHLLLIPIKKALHIRLIWCNLWNSEINREISDVFCLIIFVKQVSKKLDQFKLSDYSNELILNFWLERDFMEKKTTVYVLLTIKKVGGCY